MTPEERHRLEQIIHHRTYTDPTAESDIEFLVRLLMQGEYEKSIIENRG